MIFPYLVGSAWTKVTHLVQVTIHFLHLPVFISPLALNNCLVFLLSHSLIHLLLVLLIDSLIQLFPVYLQLDY